MGQALTHTLGPWVLSTRAGPSRCIQSADLNNGDYVCEVWDDRDAPLIAAAPDLLAALRECITDDGARCFNDDKRGEYARRRLDAISEIARAAIAKATGGTA